MDSARGRVVVNGVGHGLDRSPDEDLLGWLRDELGLTGTKYGCGEGACGACSVLVDGTLARACVVRLDEVVGRSVTTIEGLAPDGGLHPVQRGFVEVGAMQCGFCTPGMVISATELLEHSPNPTDDEIVRWMEPNVCRCCTYPRLVRAIRRAGELVGSKPVRVEPVADQSAYDWDPAVQPSAPWDLVTAEDRDYFDVLGDGLVAVAPAPAGAPGMWAPTGGAWLHVDRAGQVTAFTGKVEVGQGTRRALRLVVAREMGVVISQVRLVMGDTDLCPFDIGTFGSMSMPTAAPDLRRAAAVARHALARPGGIGPGARHVEIAPDDGLLAPSTTGPAADPAAGPMAYGGDVAAVTGTKRFASDLTRPGMLHGKVLHPPSFGARLRSVDLADARRLPGVTALVEGDFVGVIAPTTALAAAAVETVRADWELAESVAEADLGAHLRSHPITVEGWEGAFSHDAGDLDAALAVASTTLTRTYTTAYLAHIPLETRVAIAEWHDDRLTVWTGTQQPFGVRRRLAEALGTDEAHVRVIVPDEGGAFGGKHDPEVTIAAARMARAADAPVKLQWSRGEELTWGYFRPAAVIDIRVGATADGDVTAWEMVNLNAGRAAIETPYDIPNQRLRFQPAESPLRQGPYRALAATANTFARESAIDELARHLALDPLQLRLRNLRDERLAVVLRAAADRFGWTESSAGPGSGIGLALGHEKGGRVATFVEVHVEDRDLEVGRVVTAFECGAIVDRDNLENQIEGATIMGLGGAIFESIHFDRGRVLHPHLSEHRVPRFADAPPIDVVLIDRPDLPSAGAGESPMITIAPALANAVFDANGIRIRSLPFLDDALAGWTC